MHSRRVITIAVVLLVAAGGSVAFYGPQFLLLGIPRTPVAKSFLGSCTGQSGSVLIIADGRGFNESTIQPSTPWPIIRVVKGQTVDLVVCNRDPVQVHGFVMDHYLIGGIALSPGTGYKISFLASDPGSFRIYCYVFCTVHKYMLSQLVVTP